MFKCSQAERVDRGLKNRKPWHGRAEIVCRDQHREPGALSAGPFRLETQLTDGAGAGLICAVYRSYSCRGEGLATMLPQRQMRAGLNNVISSSEWPKLGTQFKMLRAVAA